ncbi:ATP-binding protein [Halosimplex salinum]|uniref:ATP-binding protein n=1 Tax=Halosimplex salinum TaxID=1710538 RepID=UPI000F4937FB|nr:ATP-binding protein [Halosimplex salinum]
MFGLNSESRKQASKQELKHQIAELKSEASRVATSDSPDQTELARYLEELEKCYRALADAESFPPLEDKYRSKAANWRKAAEEKRVVEASELTDQSSEPEPQPTTQAINEEDDDTDLFDWETPELDFSELGGREAVIDRLKELIIAPVENKEKHREYGIPVPNGVVFTGPPGTGKTTLAKALAGELGRDFLDISLADVRGSLAGESEQNLQQLFQQAVEHQPCLIVIDEVDALVYDRTSASDSAEMRQLITQFLGDMPSLSDEDVLIVGTTNMNGDMDDAATRPGRFGHKFEIDMPDATCRQEVLRVHLRERPVAASDIDFRELARHTPQYSCADLEAVTVEAARKAMNEETVISQNHLMDALESVSPSVNMNNWE